MTYAKNLGRKVRRSKKKQAEEKPLRRWDQKRLERDEAEQPKEDIPLFIRAKQKGELMKEEGG